MLAQFTLGQDLQYHSPHLPSSPLELDNAFWDHSKALPATIAPKELCISRHTVHLTMASTVYLSSATDLPIERTTEHILLALG